MTDTQTFSNLIFVEASYLCNMTKEVLTSQDELGYTDVGKISLYSVGGKWGDLSMPKKCEFIK